MTNIQYIIESFLEEIRSDKDPIIRVITRKIKQANIAKVLSP